MKQLLFFEDPPAIDAESLEGRIDPQLDAAFLAEIGLVFARLEDGAAERADANAA